MANFIRRHKLSIIEYYLNAYRRILAGRNSSIAVTGPSAFALTACGEGSGVSHSQVKGFPTSYMAPESAYVTPTESDPNFEILKPVYIDPYWIASLEMDQWDAHITPMLTDFERLIKYSFPDTVPAYDTFDLTGWGLATEEMKIATHEILTKIEEVLDIKISEIKKGSPTITNDKAAIMAGLNIASMYLGQDDKIQNLESVSDDLESIQNTLKFEGDA